MSTHFIHKFKYSHDKRRGFFRGLIKNEHAIILAHLDNGILVKTINGKDYRVSKKGNVKPV